MKLGDRVKFQKALTSWHNDWDKEETIEFAKKNNIRVLEGSEYINGIRVQSKWKVKKFQDVQEGMVCGIRTIDLNGSMDWEDGYSFGDRKKVYLVAKNLSGFWRVPEEFIISD